MKALHYLALLATVACLGTTALRAEGDAKPEHKPDAPKRERGGNKDRPERPKITDEEEAKIKAARAIAEKDPAVIAAKEAMEKAKEAKDRKAMQEARKAHMEAMHAAMIKADPSVADIVKKMPRRPFGGEGRGERGPRKGGEGRPHKDAAKPDKPAAE